MGFCPSKLKSRFGGQICVIVSQLSNPRTEKQGVFGAAGGVVLSILSP
jgi:hypothetical protein